MRIKNLRNERKWSQEYLAGRLGISGPSVSKIESGFTNVTLSCIEQIALIYDVSFLELLKLNHEQYEGSTNKSRLATLKEELTVREKEILTLQDKIIELYEELQYNKVPA